MIRVDHLAAPNDGARTANSFDPASEIDNLARRNRYPVRPVWRGRGRGNACSRTGQIPASRLRVGRVIHNGKTPTQTPVRSAAFKSRILQLVTRAVDVRDANQIVVLVIAGL